MKLSNTFIFINLGFVFLILAATQTKAETMVCELAGSTAVAEAIELHGVNPGVVGGEEQKAIALKHASLRAILAIQICPDSSEKAMAQTSKESELWASDTVDILNSYFSGENTSGGLRNVVNGIKCSVHRPIVCRIKDRLLEKSQSLKYDRSGSDLNVSLDLTLMSESASDFDNSSGAFLTQMSNLAFLFSYCPRSFLAYMHDHPKDFEHWLAVAKGNLFWGEPEDADRLKLYKNELIHRVDQDHSKYQKEKLAIIKTLTSARVYVTQ